MKTICLIPLLLLSACSTAPKLVVAPLPSPTTENSSVRYPEIVRAYHVGRYADGDSLLYEQHAVYRVEQNARWDFHPGEVAPKNSTLPRDAAFNPAPVNDAIVAELNSQKLATGQILAQSRTLAASLEQFQSALSQSHTNWQQMAKLRSSLSEMQRRLDALEAARMSQPSPAATNSSTASPFDPLMP